MFADSNKNLQPHIHLRVWGIFRHNRKLFDGLAAETAETFEQHLNRYPVITSKDDVFTVLIHLGYLSYDEEEQECYIPNKEVRMEMVNAVTGCNWKAANAFEDSKKLR